MRLLQQFGLLDLLTHLPESLVSHVFLPSTLVAVMHKDYRGEFHKRLGADTGKLREFVDFIPEQAKHRGLGRGTPQLGWSQRG